MPRVPHVSPKKCLLLFRDHRQGEAGYPPSPEAPVVAGKPPEPRDDPKGDVLPFKGGDEGAKEKGAPVLVPDIPEPCRISHPTELEVQDADDLPEVFARNVGLAPEEPPLFISEEENSEAQGAKMLPGEAPARLKEDRNAGGVVICPRRAPYGVIVGREDEDLVARANLPKEVLPLLARDQIRPPLEGTPFPRRISSTASSLSWSARPSRSLTVSRREGPSCPGWLEGDPWAHPKAPVSRRPQKNPRMTLARRNGGGLRIVFSPVGILT